MCCHIPYAYLETTTGVKNPWKWPVDGIFKGYFYGGYRNTDKTLGVFLVALCFECDEEVKKEVEFD
jgi:hypothetical protein